MTAHFQILSKRPMAKDYYSLTEVAQKLGISRQAVHKRIKRNKLKAMKIGTTYIIGKKEIKKLKA
ncbi:MAG: helix-turn-helix domain-containing protein [Candidatus Omnitrophota bacterium]